jgi:hypothetical protein
MDRGILSPRPPYQQGGARGNQGIIPMTARRSPRILLPGTLSGRPTPLALAAIRVSRKALAAGFVWENPT